VISLSHPRFLTFLFVFVVAGAVSSAYFPSPEAFILGFDAGAASFILLSLLYGGGVRTNLDDPDDGGHLLLPIVAITAILSVLMALGFLLEARRSLVPRDLAIVVATLALAWTFANLVFAYHYARLFRSAHGRAGRGGLDFPGGEAPQFSEFLYFAFVIGMTCQTADVAITDSAMRRVVTAHGVVAFVFNLGVLALTINVLSSVI